jgi:hypothetical protein
MRATAAHLRASPQEIATERDTATSTAHGSPDLPRRDPARFTRTAWGGIATAVIGAGAITMTVSTVLAQANYDNERHERTSEFDARRHAR